MTLAQTAPEILKKYQKVYSYNMYICCIGNWFYNFIFCKSKKLF